MYLFTHLCKGKREVVVVVKTYVPPNNFMLKLCGAPTNKMCMPQSSNGRYTSWMESQKGKNNLICHFLYVDIMIHYESIVYLFFIMKHKGYLQG